MIKVKAVGPRPADILLVGEAPGAEEEYRGVPFVGPSGMELTRMLHEAGIVQTECRITNVCPIRPPSNDISAFFLDKKGFVPGPEVTEGLQELELEVFQTKPKVIVALGDTALWACTGHRGITSWRGSVMDSKWGIKVIPTYHPAAILRVWEWRAITVHDLRRVKRESAYSEIRYPPWRFIVRPTFTEAMTTLNSLRQQADRGVLPLAIDIETRQSQIACIGLAWSRHDAICIPFLCTERAGGYWQPDEEIAIILALRALLTHPNMSGCGQNFAYDAQYFAKEFGYLPNLGFDTMLAQNVAFAGMPKSLDFLSSMYCTFHQYWKDEGKLWDPKMPEDRLWVYNCRDCVATFEAREELADTLDDLGLMHIFGFRMRLWKALVYMMLRGVAIDRAARKNMAMELLTEISARELWLEKVLGRPFNVRSPKQMKDLFYSALAIKPIFNRKTGTATLNDDALEKILKRDPSLRPLIRKIQELRSLGVFLSTFVQAPLDSDGRMRCSFNPAGTETFRLSSSENAFGSGTNLQNIPKGGDFEESALVLPNIRKLFIPDPGYTIADVDLAGADAQVVAWEAEDDYLKNIFRSGIKLHAVNAKDLFGSDAGPDGKREPYYTRAKMGVHACVDREHSALTPFGWCNVATIADGMPILVCNSDGAGAKFESVNWHRQDTKTRMVHIQGHAIDQLVTHDHKVPYTTGHNTQVCTAAELPLSARMYKAVDYSGPVQGNPDFLRLLCAFHADGSIAKDQVRFHLKKERKGARLQQLAAALNTPIAIHPYSDGTYNVVLSGPTADALIVAGKEPNWEILQYSAEALDAYIEELPFWDGHKAATSESFFTANLKTAQIVQTLLFLREKAGAILPGTRCYRVQINNRPLGRIERCTAIANWQGTVYCPITSTGFWLTQRGGKASITGNTNYGASANRVAEALGITIHEAERFQSRWFEIHPNIKQWQRAVMHQLQTKREVRNKFGYRRFYLDRIEGLLPEALAWIPQSTIAHVSEAGLVNVHEFLHVVRLLLQVHDSLVLQYPTSQEAEILPRLQKLLIVPVPYKDPLIIQSGLKTSTISWGDCEERKWPT